MTVLDLTRPLDDPLGWATGLALLKPEPQARSVEPDRPQVPAVSSARTLPAGPYFLDGLLWQAEHLVLPWMVERIPGMEGQSFGPASAIGIVQGEKIVGGVAYSWWFDHPEGGDVQISAVMEPGARVTRRMWRHFYGHALVTMRCRRMSMQTTRNNRAARKHAERTGWKLEGVKRQGQGRRDLVMYGLLRSECRFLKGS